MTALDDLHRWADTLNQIRHTVYCPPGMEDTVREAVHLSGLASFYDVRASGDVPPGAVFVVKAWQP